MTSSSRSFLANPTLSGVAQVPGDKSLSHRSLIFGALAIGTTEVEHLLQSDDVMRTLTALKMLGVEIRKEGNRYLVEGRGISGLQSASGVIDCGNSGTSVRLLMGLVAGYDFPTFFSGDASLRQRPMRRVVTPLEQMGAEFHCRDDSYLPLMVRGSEGLLPIQYRLPVASAQVKSAILLAALNAPGKTTVIEPHPSRDHTERMLAAGGWACDTITHQDGSREISLLGQYQPPRRDAQWQIPADPSSAAFPLIAAIITPHSRITLPAIGMNPLRAGLFTTLQEMGAKLTLSNPREIGGEPVADIAVEASDLRGITVPAERAPSMIDEYPILAVAAALASGTSRFCGLHELRVKESDRLTLTAEGLQQCGIKAEIDGDDLIIHGSGGADIAGGAQIESHHDHRIAMSFLCLGLRAKQPIRVTGCETIATSFPEFFSLMRKLGVKDLPSHTPHPAVHTSPIVIAIDGPAASGKGTLARRLAERLGLRYLDTGSLYRAVGLKLIYNDASPEDEAAALEAAQSIDWQDLQNPRLRQEKIGHAASVVSAMPAVREALLAFQRKIARDDRGAVLDGRDIGTTICPDADYKFFITASLETRAERRHRELTGQGITVIYDSVLQDLEERDARDQQRDASPLKPAPDARTIDTSNLTAEEVFEQIAAMIEGVG